MKNKKFKSLIISCVSALYAFAMLFSNVFVAPSKSNAEVLNYNQTVSTLTSSSGGSNSNFTIKEYSLTDLVEATTLENYEKNGTVNPNLATTDLVWLPTNTDLNNLSSSEIKTERTDFVTSFSAYWVRGINFNTTMQRFVNSTNGNINENTANTNYSLRPALQLNLSNVLSLRNVLDITIDSVNKTIEIPNMMYPQSAVPDGALNTALEQEYTKYINEQETSIVPTNKTYYGIVWGSTVASCAPYEEFLYNGNYYVRYVGSSLTPRTRYWLKVEPIVWRILNWGKMPKSINESGDEEATSIIALSEKSLIECKYYQGEDGNSWQYWQNSFARAYLNGYDLAEQNNGTNGNATYASAIQANFKGVGFADTVWHDLKPALIVKTELANNGWNSDRSAVNRTVVDLTTNDYVWIPSYDTAGTDPTRVQKMLTSSGGGLKTLPTDWTIANHVAYSLTGNVGYYALRPLTNGWPQSYSYGVTGGGGIRDVPVGWMGYGIALRPSMQLKLETLQNLSDKFCYTFNEVVQFGVTYKTIVFPNIMYPQTKVATGSDLENALNLAYNGGSLKNNMIETGVSYVGWENNSNTSYSANYDEYLYNGSYYVYAPINRNSNSNTLPFSDEPEDAITQGTKLANGNYAWFKVEPIEWIVSNWSTLPTSFTNATSGGGDDTTLYVISLHTIAEIGIHGGTGDFQTMYQNSRYRAYLNGYDLETENSRGNGNSNYVMQNQYSFKGNGFLDTIWHEFLPDNVVAFAPSSAEDVEELMQTLQEDDTKTEVAFAGALNIDDTFVEDYGDAIDFLGRKLTSLNLSDTLSFDGEYVNVTASNAVTIKNFAIDNISSSGTISRTFNVVVDEGATLTIENCVFENLSSTNGGAISLTSNGNLNVVNCAFDGCTATGNGGAIYYTGTGNVSLQNCVFTNCSADNGGAIYAEGAGNMTITSCQFGGYVDVNANNIFDKNDTLTGACTADADGGYASVVSEKTNLVIDSCVFYGKENANVAIGGTINSTGDLTVIDSKFYSCKSNSGATVRAGNNNYIKNCTFGLFDDVNANGIFESGDTVKFGCETWYGAIQLWYKTGKTVVDSCNFYNCSASTGGVISFTSSDTSDNICDITIINCNFIDVSGGKGAVYASGGSNRLNVINCKFDACSVGAIYASCNVTVTNCSFGQFNDVNNDGIFDVATDSTTNGCGEPIFITYNNDSNNKHGNCKVIVRNSNFNGCNAKGYGVVYCRDANINLEIIGCRFVNCEDSGNTSAGSIVFAEGAGKSTITNCYFDSCKGKKAGAIYVGGELKIDNCVFVNNTSSGGPGVLRTDSGKKEVYNSIFKNNQNNSTVGYGGAIAAGISNITNATVSGVLYNKFAMVDATLTIDNCVFESNSSTVFGGAILSLYKNTTIVNSTFKSNSAKVGGAVVYQGANRNNAEGQLAVDNCNFFNNTSTGTSSETFKISLYAGLNTNTDDIVNNSYDLNCGGGALYVLGGTANITSSNFGGFNDANNNGEWDSGETTYGNTAQNYGGAVCYTKSTVVCAKNTNFLNNASNKHGGAIFRDNVGENLVGEDVFEHCYFAYNTATEDGGAVADKADAGKDAQNRPVYTGGTHPMNFANCTFMYNGAFGSGGVVYVATYGHLHKFDYCYFGYNYASSSGGIYSSQYSYEQFNNCVIEKNIANTYSAIKGYYLTLNGCKVVDNVCLENANLEYSSSVFWNHGGYSAGLNTNDNSNMMIIKNNYADVGTVAGGKLYDESSFMVNPFNTSSKLKVVKSSAFDETTFNLKGTFLNYYTNLSIKTIYDANLSVNGSNTCSAPSLDKLDVWLHRGDAIAVGDYVRLISYDNGWTDIAATNDKNNIYNVDLSHINYDNNNGNYILVLDSTYRVQLVGNDYYWDGVYVKYVNPSKDDGIEYTASNYKGTYDSAPHGIDVKVYNLNEGEYTIEYSLKDFNDANFNPSTDILDENPTEIFATNVAKIIYFRIRDIRTGVTNFATITGSRRILINKKQVRILYNNPTFVLDDVVVDVQTNTTELNNYLRGVMAIDNNGQAVSGRFVVTNSVGSVKASDLTKSLNLKFIPYNSVNYDDATLTVTVDVESAFDKLYYNNGAFYTSYENATNSTNASDITTLSAILRCLKQNGTVYFMSTYNVSANETINLENKNITFVNNTTDSSAYSGTLITVNSGKTLTILATKAGAMLTIERAETTIKTNNSLVVNNGTLDITGNVILQSNNSSSNNNENGNGAGIYNTGTLKLTGVDLNNNTAKYGGAIYVNSGSATLTNCNIYKNKATGANSADVGGAIFVNGGSLTLINCWLYKNQSNNDSISNVYSKGDLTVNNSTIYNIIVDGTLTANVTNSYITEIESLCTTGGKLNLSGNFNTTLNYYFYEESNADRHFKVVDNGISADSKFTLVPKNASADLTDASKGLVAIYSVVPESKQYCFSLNASITGITLGATASGYFGLVSTTSSSASGGTSTPGIIGNTSTPGPEEIDDGSITLEDLVLPTTLENTDTTGTVQTALATTDLVWIPSQSEITTYTGNIFSTGTEGEKRRVCATDFAKANNAYNNNNSYATASGEVNTTRPWTRSPYSSSKIYCVLDYGAFHQDDADTTNDPLRPAMQINLDVISALDIKIDASNKTIVIPNIMYPQTRVDATLTATLEASYNGGNLINDMKFNNNTYYGFTNSSGASREFNEYVYNSTYYARYVKDENGNAISSGTNNWYKVEPIVWYITNWSSLPKAITGEETEIATPDTTITVLSQYALTCCGKYYPNSTDTGCSLWQNSNARAFLNGYDLSEQNNGTNGSNNSSYKSPIQANFKGKGFVQSLWHDHDLIIKSLVKNIDSYTGAVNDDLDTHDYLWIAMNADYGTYTNNIGGSLATTPTDFTIANNINVYTSHSNYDAAQGTSPHWATNIVDDRGRYWAGSNSWGYISSTDLAARPFMSLNINTVKSTLAKESDLAQENKTLVKEVKTLTNSKKVCEITITNMMYPQTHVATGSTLETNLNNAYNSGTLRNGMISTGVKYPCYDEVTWWNEYYYNGAYYVYVSSIKKKNDSTSIKFSDELANNVENGKTSGSAWFKVEPIVWYVANWNKLPKSFTGENTSGADDKIILVSKYCIISIGAAQRYVNGRRANTLWQNDRYRAYLNSYDLSEQNNGYNGSNGADYIPSYYPNFKGNGFLDVTYHTPTLTVYLNSVAGSDSNDGLGESKPLQSFSKFKTLYGGMDVVDKIVLKNKITINDAYVTNNPSLVVNGVLTLDFENKYLTAFDDGTSAFTNYWFDISTTTPVEIKNFVVDGNVVSSTYNSAVGVRIKTSNISNVTLSNVEILNCTQRGLTVNGPITLKDCLIHNNSVTANVLVDGTSVGDNTGGGVYITGALQVENCLIYGNLSTGAGGGAFFTGSGTDTVTITNCKFYNNKSGASEGGGANIRVASTITNCEFYNNTATGSGGGVYAAATSGDANTFTNCQVYNNSARDAGGIYCKSDLTINNCEIYGNVARYGGGVYQNTSTSTVVITNSKFYENKTHNYSSGTGGGINISGALTLINCDIYNNTTRIAGGGIYYSNGENAPANITNCRIYGNTTNGVAAPGGGIRIGATAATLTNCQVYNNTASGNGGGVWCSGALSLTNCQVYNNKHDKDTYGNTADCSGGAVYSGATTSLTNCNLYNNTATGNGGAVYSTTTVTANNSKFYNNTSSGSGGGVYSVGALEATNCYIYNNTASVDGGGIHSGGDLTLTGCNIYNNTATGRGGGVCKGSSGTNKITNCNIYNNTAINGTDGNFVGGGGLVLNGGLTAENCNFYNNIVKNNTKHGGGMYVMGAAANLKNCNVFNNIATAYGGGIAATVDITLTRCNVYNNNSKEVGGGFWTNGDSTLIDCFVYNNQAGIIAGGFYSKGATQVTGCNIYNNTATGSGGGIYTTSTLTMKETNVYNNTAKGSAIGGDYATAEGSSGGGGVYCRGETKIEFCNIYNNTTAGFGGGVYNTADKDVTIKNSNLYGNRANIDGGAVCSWGNVKVLYSNIYGNKATENGGAICNYFKTAANSDYRRDLTLQNTKIYSNSCENNVIACRWFVFQQSNLFDNTSNGDLILTTGLTGKNSNSNVYDNISTSGSIFPSNGNTNVEIVNFKFYNNICFANVFAIHYLQYAKDCEFYNNRSTNGNLFAVSESSCVYENLNIYGNYAKSTLLSLRGSLKNCKITGNECGGSLLGSYNFSVDNCAFANNKFSALVSSSNGYTMQNSTFSGNFSTTTFVTLGTYWTASSSIATYENCQFFNNVSYASGGCKFMVCVDGELNLTNCRFSNNLVYNGSSYVFGEIYTDKINNTKRGEMVYGTTNITNCDFSYNQKDNQGADHTVGANGLVNYTQDSNGGTIENTTISNNNLGSVGAIVSEGNVNITLVTFENNTGKLGAVASGNVFGLDIINNNLNNNDGFVINGDAKLYNITIEGNTNGSALIFGQDAVALVEGLVATNNGGNTVNGPVVKNLGLVTISSGNTQFKDYMDAIFNNNLDVNKITKFVNNVGANGGTIYNAGNLTLLNIVLGDYVDLNNNKKYDSATDTTTPNSAQNGGAVFNAEDGTLTLQDCVLQFNTANSGGAVYNMGVLTINTTDLTNNSATVNGGAIYSLGNIILNSGNLSNNTAVNGGAIYNAGTLTINGGDLTNNMATGNGGAICNTLVNVDTNNNGIDDKTYTGKLVVNYANISGNTLNANNAKGGAIYNDEYMIVNDGWFEGNCETKRWSGTAGGTIFASGKHNFIYGGYFFNSYANRGSFVTLNVSSDVYISNVYMVLNSVSMNYGGYIYAENSTSDNYGNLVLKDSLIECGSLSATYNYESVIYANNYNNLEFDNVIIRNIKKKGNIFETNNGVNLTVKNCSFDGCDNSIADSSIHGIFKPIFSSNLIVDNCKFYNNTYYQGGRLLWVNGFKNVKILNSKFVNNFADDAIIYFNSPTSVWGSNLTNITIDNCVFENNSSKYIFYNDRNLTDATLSYLSIKNNYLTQAIANLSGQLYSFKGNNVITNNFIVEEDGALGVGVYFVQNSNTAKLNIGFGSKLVIDDNWLIKEQATAGADTFEFNGNNYKKVKQVNLTLSTDIFGINSSTNIIGGLQEGSKIGLSIYSADSKFELSSLVGQALFSGENVSSSDFNAFYMDNNAGVLKLENNKIVLASVGNPTSSVVTSDVVFVVDGQFKGLANHNFAVFDDGGNKLADDEFVALYSLDENAMEYLEESPTFAGVGEYTIFYKIYDLTQTNLIGSGSVKLKIVNKTLTLITNPTAFVSKGSALSTATFVGGLVVDNYGQAIAGTWAFTASATPTDTTTTYAVKFTPVSTETYTNGSSVTLNIPVSFKFNYVVYKEVSGVTGFYLANNTYTGFNKLEDIVKYIAHTGMIYLEKTYTFTTSEKIVLTEEVNIIIGFTNASVFAVSGENTVVEFAGPGKAIFGAVTFNNANGYLFNISANTKLILNNVVISGISKNVGSTSIVAIINNAGTLELNNTNISGNTIQANYSTDDAKGGLIYNNSTGVVNVNGSVFVTNASANSNSTKGICGSVIYNDGGVVNFNGGKFSNNNAGGTYGYGGVVYTNGGAVNINGGQFVGNIAKTSGGVIYATNGNVVITGGTFKFNQASSGDVLNDPSQAPASTVVFKGQVVTDEILNAINVANVTIDDNAKQVVSASLGIVLSIVCIGLIVLTFASVYKFKHKKILVKKR